MYILHFLGWLKCEKFVDVKAYVASFRELMNEHLMVRPTDGLTLHSRVCKWMQMDKQYSILQGNRGIRWWDISLCGMGGGALRMLRGMVSLL